MHSLLDAPLLHGFVPSDTSIGSPPARGDTSWDFLRTAVAVARYSGHFLPAVLRRHSFVAPAELPTFRKTVALPARRIEQWTTFFGCHDGTIPPLTFFTAENSRLLFRLAGKFGLNFKHLLLVGHDLLSGAGPSALVPGEDHDLAVTVEGLRVWPRQRVTFTCRCVARRAGHSEPVFETADQFLVKNVRVADCEALTRRGCVGNGTNKETTAPRLDPTSPSVRRNLLPVPMEAGIRFGVLSGDLNLVHAHPGLARLFGHRRPFAQGLYTSNLVAATLSRLIGDSPRRFSIRFCRPLFLGQDATLLHTEESFQVLDAQGHLVAAGTWCR